MLFNIKFFWLIEEIVEVDFGDGGILIWYIDDVELIRWRFGGLWVDNGEICRFCGKLY